MKFEIKKAGILPVLEADLNEGEKVYTDKGSMCWMDPTVKMDSNIKGGLFKGIGRLFSGEKLFLNTFTGQEGGGKVTFAPSLPGTILEFDINSNKSVICQKGSFLAAEEDVKLSMHFHKKIGAGLFGGEGFILQKLSGEGKAFLEIDGSLVEKELKEGEVLLVDQGNLAFFEESVTYTISRVKGFKNIFFSGEGLLLVKLVGPGKIGLQTMPVKNLATSLTPYLPKPKTRTISSGSDSSSGGSLLGSLLNKD